jgi:hypothetical protein
MLISDRDDKWMQAFMKKIIPEKNPATVSSEDYKEGLLAYLATVDKDPSKRSVGGLSRGSDGTFDNASLTKILTESTKDCAGNSSLSVNIKRLSILASPKSSEPSRLSELINRVRGELLL